MASKKYRKLNEKDGRAEAENPIHDEVKEDDWRDWAYLPEGIVAEVGDMLLAHDFVSYVNLRRVSRSWAQATEPPTNTDRQFRPHNWVLAHPKANLCLSDRHQNRRHFLNISTGERIWVDIPELDNRCIRACVDGLLLMTNADSTEIDRSGASPTCWLLNPFTHETTEYPALPKICSIPSKVGCWQLRPPSICFASSNAATLMAVTRTDVAYADPRSKEWKLVDRHSPPGAVHMAHALFGSFTYVFSITRTRKCVEFRLTRYKVEEANSDHVSLAPECLTIARNDLTKYIGWDIVSLVESDGELLLLSQSPQRSNPDFFRVFKVVIKEGECAGEGKATLVPLNDIGKHAIFINQAYESISVSTDVFPCYKPNSIYCCHASSLTVYHAGGPYCDPIDPIPSPTSNCYWAVENIQLTGKSNPVFPSFRPPNGKCRRTENC